MSTNNPRGFVEHRHLSGANSPATRRYRVKANGDSGTYQKFAGDPVTLVSGDTVGRLVMPATTASMPVIGVIRAVYDSNGKPFTHSNLFIPSSTAGLVDVNIDPHQTYLVNTDATVVSTLIGQYCEATANTPNTAAGRSGFSIEVATGTNTAAANGVPFQVIGIGANNLDGIVGGENNQDVEVILSNPALQNANKVR